ncbi:MAG: hypothetical protein HQM10_14035 [Candidatus Riflebacteria bacterium]|nr:hypothetical protein [Candidatus Riflebacteria bacterium]
MNRNAMSMIELLLGVVIFSFAMLPLLWMGITTGKSVYSVGKHIMAGQLAAGQLDRLLSLNYNDCIKKIEATTGEQSVMSDPLLDQILKNPALADSGEMKNDLEKSFKNFKYEWTKTDASGPEKDQMFEIAVRISWLVEEGNPKTRQQMTLRAVKFRETL